MVDMVDSYVAPRAYVDIMFMHCNLHHVILSWLSILHSSLTGLN